MKNITIPITEPCLSRAADLIIENHCQSKNYDFSNVTIILPGSRAGRRLLEILCEKLANKNSLFSPPNFLTPGKFCELFISFSDSEKIASDVEEIFAWILALKNEKNAVEVLLNNPAPENFNYLSLALNVRQIYNELAGDLISFDDVAKAMSENERECERWLALDEIHKSYFKCLEMAGVTDKALAITKTFQAGNQIKFFDYIYVIGVVDIFERFRLALNSLADKIIIISHGENEWFNPDGELKQDVDFENMDELISKIKFCGNHSEQAAETVTFFRGLEGKYSSRDIIISAPDDDVRRPLKQFLDEVKIPNHDSIGTVFAQTEIGILLKSITDYINDKNVKTFLNLICHPVIEKFICPDKNKFSILIKNVQEFASEHVLELTDSEKFDEKPQLKKVIENIDCLIMSLCEVDNIKGCVNKINGILAELYNVGHASSVSHICPSFHIDAIKKWCELADRIISSNVELNESIDSAKTIKLMCQLLAVEKLVPESETETVDIIGWLELPLDDAPVVVLTGMNEGIVPESKLSHVFLPNSLRNKLGIQDNSRRLNRDRYYLRSIIQSAEKVLVTMGKYSSKQDPLLPSRLLLDVSGKNQAKIIEKFYNVFNVGHALDRRMPGSSVSTTAQPKPPNSEQYNIVPDRHAGSVSNSLPDDENIFLDSKVKKLGVTRFKDFLECPYRFYLKYKKIIPCKDLTKEMPAWQFGNVVHKVLEKFGKINEAKTDNQNVIRSILKKLLDEVIVEEFGNDPHVAVLIQKDSIIKRLNVFADVQAKRFENNWLIRETEQMLEIELGEFKITGKVDRIDEKYSQKSIIDYKTSSTIKDVYLAHYNKKEEKWKDLQLPLYAYWGKKQNNGKIPETAYFIIQKDTKKINVLEYQWNENEISDAINTAMEIFKKINSNEKNSFKRTEIINHCRYCDYKKLCNRDV